MYLVELRPGKEELYRSGDELAAAIRRGDVDGHSRIYHRATSKWISITLHPQYKAIVAEKVDSGPGADRTSWTYLNAQSETLEGAALDDDTSGDEGRSGEGTSPWRRPLALSITGLLLVLGIQMAFSGPRPPWANRPIGPAVGPAGRGAVASPAAASPAPVTTASHIVSLASTTTGWDGIDLSTELSPSAPPLPKAPRLRAASLGESLPVAPKSAPPAGGRTIDALLAGYSSAYDSARTRLASGMRVSRLNQLFAPARLAPNGGLTETRLALAGAANFIRVYRQQEAAIEREYQDSFTVVSREDQWSTQAVRRWYSRPALKEPVVLAGLSGNLLNAVDSVLGVLGDQAGAYRIDDERIRFEDPAAARIYGGLRQHIGAALDSARVAGGAETGTPMAQLIEAIGATRLPREF